MLKSILTKLEKNGDKVIYLTETGSKLHGTDSENSDTDYKGIYIPNKKSVLLNNYQSVINISTGDDNSKNGKDDLDIELYSVQTFFKKAASMESNTIEILFSMFSDKVIIKTEESIIIKNNSRFFLSNNFQQFIGFAMSMAYRYSEKGDRLREVEELKNYFERFIQNMSKEKVKKTPISELNLETFVQDKEYLDIVELDASDGKKALYLKVLSANYILSNKLGYVYKGISSKLNSFGKRAAKAKDSDGIDRKAFAHALRAILQSKELIHTGKIIYPLQYADRLRELKFSDKLSKKELSDIIEEEHEKLLELLQEKNSLPEKVEWELLNDILYSVLQKGLSC